MYTPVLGVILKVGAFLFLLVSFHIYIEITRTQKILNNMHEPLAPYANFMNQP